MRWEHHDDGDDDDDIERTTAFGFWNFGLKYLQAAVLLKRELGGLWVDSTVSQQCVCQGLELALKSYLRANGYTIPKLIKTGHSLVKCLRLAEGHGLPALPDAESAAIRSIDRYYREHEFRYISVGWKDYPPFELLISAGAIILDSVSVRVADSMQSPQLVRRMKFEADALLKSDRQRVRTLVQRERKRRREE